jgi:hypothetical protein
MREIVLKIFDISESIHIDDNTYEFHIPICLDGGIVKILIFKYSFDKDNLNREIWKLSSIRD